MQPNTQPSYSITQVQQKGPVNILGIIVTIAGILVTLLDLQSIEENWDMMLFYDSTNLIKWVLHDLFSGAAIILTGIALIMVDKRLP